jgi:signal transduction histidine kinase
LLVGTILAVAVTYLVSVIAATVVMRRALLEQFDDKIVEKARQLVGEIEQHRDELEIEIDPHTISDAEVIEVWVRGESKLRSPVLGDHHLAPLPGVRDAELPDGRRARQAAVEARARREGPGHAPRLVVMLALAASTEGVEAAVQRTMFVMIGIGVVGLGACIGLLLFVVNRTVHPLRALASRIAAIRPDDLGARLARPDDAAELAPVAQRLDELLARLAIAFERERELSAEVAHELRTPLAGLRATLELALARPRTEESYRRSLAQCLDVTVQTERMVSSLLSLARLEAGQAVVVAAPLDLDQLVLDIVEAGRARCADRRVTLHLELAPTVVTSDAEKLRVVIANLIDNAISYTDEGGDISITLDEHTLRVTNSGCALTREQLGRIGERFWRADSARGHDGHVGLGLPLACKLASLLAATLAFTIDDGRFVAELRPDRHRPKPARR